MMFADYLKETKGQDCLVKDGGFLSYRIEGPECYIVDIYVAPEFRQKGLAWEMMQEVVSIAQGKSCKFLTGTVGTNAQKCSLRASTISLKAMLAVGFEVMSSTDDYMILVKPI